MTQKLIERLEQILPGIQNSNSAAEVAMVEALPEVIAEITLLTALVKDVEHQNQAQGERIAQWKRVLVEAKLEHAKEMKRLKAERDAMAEALIRHRTRVRDWRGICLVGLVPTKDSLALAEAEITDALEANK
jgi:hypothetical protein